MIERWNIGEREHWEQFAREPFVSVDPGADGYAMAWLPDVLVPVSYCHALEPQLLAEALLSISARVLVVEAQYIAMLKNANNVLELRGRQFMALGWAACVLHEAGEDLHVFEVSPSTWQAMQRRRVGRRGHPKRGEGIDLAIARGAAVFGDDAEWRKARKKQREGMASALGIGEHWRDLTGLDLFECPF